jgi:hypothetical protein
MPKVSEDQKRRAVDIARQFSVAVAHQRTGHARDAITRWGRDLGVELVRRRERSRPRDLTAMSEPQPIQRRRWSGQEAPGLREQLERRGFYI